MPNKQFLQTIGFLPKEGEIGIFYKKYSSYSIQVNLENNAINYGGKIVFNNTRNTVQNITKPEDWVVLECVNRLLEKGYKPENIILEKIWPAGHQHSGRLDICVVRDDRTEYLLIECKTYGKEFDKAFARLNKDGGQLFTYFKFSNKADLIMLYASELREKEIVYRNEIIKIEDDHRTGDVKDFYEKWNKLTKDNGAFDSWVKPYNYESKALTVNDLEEIRQEDSSFIFNRFLEILRHNVVSDKGNAFNRIFTLFLCKIYDEKINEETDNELGFQWLEGIDDHKSFQLRLSDLYKNGMYEFLEKVVTDFSETEFNNKFNYLSEQQRQPILEEFRKIRLEKNNEFAIKDVYDEQSFNENAVVVKEIVQLLEKYKLRYAKKQQYLSDFFELLLTTGLKQESGQFFTPVPIAQFIIKSLPIDTVVEERLSSAKIDNDTLLPYVIDYAAGSGHFLTEAMHEIQRLIDQKDDTKYHPSVAKKIRNWKDDHFAWAINYIYGIEKDYRLVKVGKVGCYLHGDGLANVIHSDGLARFSHPDYKGKLLQTDKDFPKDNKQFDMLISNPPYSVSAFKNAARAFYKEESFDLYDSLTESSSEIETLFVERTKQLLKDGGVAGIILPSSILSNTGIYSKTREIILQYFEIIAITELGSNTFMATGTNTVVLFLRRRNNYESINLKKAVEKFFTDYKDVTLNGVEKPFSKYLAHVWEGVKFDDYISLLKKEPNKTIETHEIYKEYRKKLRAKDETVLFKQILERETEKLFYFILAYPQKVVLIKSGQKDSEKRFLGYEFSNRRGSEGIHPIQRGKSIAECTKLFDENSFENEEKASTYIYRAFKDDFESEIHESLKKNISRQSLVDMLTFDRVEFEKNISLAVKKKVKIETKWEKKKLGEIVEIKGGNGFPKEYQGGQNLNDVPFYKVSDMNTAVNETVMTIANNYVDKRIVTDLIKATLFPVDTIIFPKVGRAIDTNKKRILKKAGCVDNNVMGITVKNKGFVLPKYLFYFFALKINLIDIASAANPPSISATNLAEFQIPLPPLDIQEKIVTGIEVLEKRAEEAKNEIVARKNKIETLFSNILAKSKTTLRLSDNIVFDVSIGKRLLKNEILPEGNYPVFSANVFEPFGYVNSLLIKDFSVPSVLWGIDGDWMVNYYPKDKPFYPTDHCGVLRVKNNAVNERYLAFVLEKEGKSFEFSRSKRASIDKIQNIKIPVPSLAEQQKIVSEVEKVESKISILEKEIAEIPKQKEEVLKKYL